MPEWTPGRELDAELARLMGWKQHDPTPSSDWWNHWEHPDGRHSLLPEWSTDEAQVGALLTWLGKQEWLDDVTVQCPGGEWIVVIRRCGYHAPTPNKFGGWARSLPGALAEAAREALAAMEAQNATE